jgi:hypothetical protein
MNKTIIIAGGACVASLAAGGAAGYLIAKNQLSKMFDDRMERELEETRRHYGRLLAKSREEQKPSLEELAQNLEKKIEEAPPVEDDEPSDEEIMRQQALRKRGKAALVDYQGISTKKTTEAAKAATIADNTERHNVFGDPPRGKDGKFLPRQHEESDPPAQQQGEKDYPVTDPPYQISALSFVTNVQGHEQENLKWFPKNNALIKVFDGEIEDYEIERVGQSNLNAFDLSAPEEKLQEIFVRNDQLEMDYEITLTWGSLEEYMGMDELGSDELEEGNLNVTD